MSDRAVGLRPEEEWVRQLISAALDVRVDQHDDGSLPGMHDLNICHGDQPRAAVEVTAAADQESIEIWNLMNGDGRWSEEGLIGGWMVELRPQARAKRLRRELPELLKSLELQSVTEIQRPTRHAPRRPEGVLAEALGVVYARQSGTDFPGSIYVTVHQPLDKMAGFVSESGEPLVEWIGTFPPRGAPARRPGQARPFWRDQTARVRPLAGLHDCTLRGPRPAHARRRSHSVVESGLARRGHARLGGMKRPGSDGGSGYWIPTICWSVWRAA